MGRGAHARLVGEQAAGNAIAHRLLHGHTQRAAHDGLRSKRAHKDLTEGLRKVFNVHEDDHEAAHHVEQRHHGHDFLRCPGQALDAAQEYHDRQHRHDDADQIRAQAECVVKGFADGIGLHHVAHEPKGQNDGNREEHGQHLAQRAGEGLADVIDGTARHGTIRTDGLGLLRQHRLGVDRRHAKEGADPHPEDRAGAAGNDGRGSSCDVARSDLCGNGSGQRLKSVHAVLARLAAIQRKAGKHVLHARAKAPDLHKPQPDGKVDAGTAKQKQQYPVPENLVDDGHDVHDDNPLLRRDNESSQRENSLRRDNPMEGEWREKAVKKSSETAHSANAVPLRHSQTRPLPNK